MSTFIPESGTQHDFIPHPACRTLGVCADVYLLERLNNFFGKASTLDGKVDNYKTRRVIRFVWLTEVLTADGKPSYVSREFTASDNEKSSLYKFLVAWHPEVSGKRLSKIDMDVFVGSGADLVITNTPSKDGRSVYANVAMCAIPRPTDVVPQIPSDFKRADVRKKQEWEDKAINKQFPDFQIRYAEPQSGPALSPSPLQQRPAFSPAPVQFTNAPSAALPVFGGQAPQQGEQRPFTPVDATPDEPSQINDDLPF